MSKSQRKIMRCEALFHFIKVKTFTKQHLIRVVYVDETGVEVSTNALHLKFSSIRLNDDNTEKREIVYIRHDFMTGIHILYRSGCILEKHAENNDWLIKKEIVLSWIEIGHVEELINLYLNFTDGLENFNLTFLRKIASKKSNIRVKDTKLQSHVHQLYDEKNHAKCCSGINNITHHVLELQLHVGSVVFSHQQYNECLPHQCSLDYLVKNDILSYVDFLRLNQIILTYEMNRQHSCIEANNLTHQSSSLLKLDYICEQLTNDREDKTNKLRKKRKFHEICDEALNGFVLSTTSNKCNKDDNVVVVVDDTDDNLFLF